MGCPVRCEVNPQAGREKEFAIRKAETSRRIVIVGGGIAGMEAARVAALYGHKVTLIERGSQLGGHFIEATKPSFKCESADLLRWLIRQVNQSGVEIILNQEADPAYVRSLCPDAVIVAVGSEYVRIPISGIDEALTPDVVLNDASKAGARVAILGSGLIGKETALHLAENGKQVTLFKMHPDIVTGEGDPSGAMLDLRMNRAGVDFRTSSPVTSVQDGVVTYTQADGSEQTMQVDTVVVATGLQASRDVADLFANTADEVYSIGDCNTARMIYECFHEAWHAVRQISGVA